MSEHPATRTPAATADPAAICAPSRRDLLRAGGALAALPLARRAAGGPGDGAGGPALVCVFLRGGVDFLNVVVPWQDPDYLAARPTIAVTGEDGALPLDDTFALHPALAPLQPYWADGRLAFVHCVGSPDPTRSHFDAQDYMERGAPGDKSVRTGWLNRYLLATAGSGDSRLRALAMQGLLPRSLRGPYPVLAVPEGLERGRNRQVLDAFRGLYRPADHDPVRRSGAETLAILDRYLEIGAVAGGGEDAGFPDSAFGRRLAQAARLLLAGEGVEVVGLDYGGWDHHVQEGDTGGRLQTMLADLGASLAAFARQLGPALDRTLVLVMSEFGRTVKENGNAGTDHGRGGGMLLLGGGVRGGRVHGDWRGLAQGVLADGRDLPVTTDFRDVMAAVLAEVLGFEVPAGFFPGHRPGRLRLF